jgi:hypothetical protein
MFIQLFFRDYQEFRAEVGHDGSKGARLCRDAKNLASLTPFWTSCWLRRSEDSLPNELID